jgi:deazaflavin-dependent oxidoreductase (nitroreductase family)
MAQEHVTDSPSGWVNRHIQQYVETDGAKGHHFYGHDSLLLTTRGRKSGMRRRTALYYGKDGDNHILVASNGGATHHPLWYLNLTANPRVEVQVLADRFAANARTATGAERERLWELMASLFPTYNDYRAKAPREIPVVVLEPATS